MYMKSANPVLKESTFSSLSVSSESQMTIQGTVNKTALSLVLLSISAAWTWERFFTMGASATLPFMILGMVVGLILGFVTIFKKHLSATTVPIFAIAEGLFLGGLSAQFESAFPGIVLQAVSLTFAVLFSLLAAYKSGLIKVTENFKLGVAAATGGIAMVYLLGFIFSLFGLPFTGLFGGGLIGIGFSLFVVVIASLNLVMDFDFIEHGAERGAPKYMEWYGSFGLLVTLIWLYIEILHLLSKLRSR